jgi:uncharacterized membrane protein YdbT with pleckstrin-like domain
VDLHAYHARKTEIEAEARAKADEERDARQRAAEQRDRWNADPAGKVREFERRLAAYRAGEA